VAAGAPVFLGIGMFEPRSASAAIHQPEMRSRCDASGLIVALAVCAFLTRRSGFPNQSEGCGSAR